jgi:hypothetical protein
VRIPDIKKLCVVLCPVFETRLSRRSWSALERSEDLDVIQQMMLLVGSTG